MDLSGVDLSGVDLSGVDLSDATFSGAPLIGANLGAANLACADLSRTDLSGADLSDTILANASLVGSVFSKTDFSGSYLFETDFSGAHIRWTVFGDVDLSLARGLEAIKHDGPSIIDINTFYRSQGNIPEVFLRGAGVPEDFILNMKSLVGRPFEFYSCFISYSSKDQEFAKHLHTDLQNKGVRCWFAPHDIQSGRKIHEQIDQAIRLHERLLLILSAHSMESEWVKTEIAKARQREVQEKRQVLFPVGLVPYGAIRQWECFDADTGKDSAREIREYFIPDFSNWKNYDVYQEAFTLLLRDLKADTTQGRS